MSGVQHDAYRPVVEDGRGIFPEDVRVKAPRGSREAIAAAAQLRHTTQSEWIRQSLLRALEADGVKLCRGTVKLVAGLGRELGNEGKRGGG
jgi:hypothetical protein